MRFSYEPGDGSFCITLEIGEPVHAEWNVLGNVILRETAPNEFTVVKSYNEIITDETQLAGSSA